MGVERRLMARRGKALPAPAAQERGIQAAAEVQLEREAVIRLTVDLACWFRFWVAIFTGVVEVEDPDIPLVAETVEWEEVVVERLIQTAVERV
jgi:hypothetical protein